MLTSIWCLLAGVALALAHYPPSLGLVSSPTPSGTKYSTTTKGFSTVIPCPYCDNASVATVTSPEQIIIVSRSTSTKTVLAVTTTSYRCRGRPVPKVETVTSYTTLVREWNALYRDLGPLAIDGYTGSDLCQRRCYGSNGEVLQVLKATGCQSDNAASATCSIWPETWMFQSTPTTASMAKAVVTSSAVTLSSAGTFVFQFVQRAPPATFYIPARTVIYTTTNPAHVATTVTVTVTKTSVVFASREWTAMVTKSCSRPTVTDLTVTVSTTLVYTMPPFTPPPSRPTPAPVPTSWADWVISSTLATSGSTDNAAPISTGTTKSSTRIPFGTSTTAISSSTTTSLCNSATATAASGMTYELYYHGAGNMSVRAVELTWIYNGSLPICDAAALCAQDEFNLRGNAPSSFDVVKWLGFDNWYCNLYLTANTNPNAFRQRQALIIDAYAYNGILPLSSSASSATGTSSSPTSSAMATAATTMALTASTVTPTTTAGSSSTTTCSDTLVTVTAGQSSLRYNRYFYGTGIQVPAWQAGSPLLDAEDACSAIRLCASDQAAINTEDGTFVVAWDEHSQQWKCFTHAVGTSAANPEAFVTPDVNVGAVYAYGLDIPLPTCYHFTVNETSFSLYYTGSGNMDSRTPTGSAVINANAAITSLCDATRSCANLLYGQNPDVGDFDVYVARGQPETWYCNVYAGDSARDSSVYSIGSNDVIRMYGYTSE